MTQLTSQSFSADDGHEYAGYIGHLTGECDRLQREGRIPDDEHIQELLTFLRNSSARVQESVRASRASGLTRVTTSVPMTAGEHSRIASMVDGFNSLLFILEMRGAVDLKRTEAATRVLRALMKGTYGT